eukprot:Phypoly_transcript_05164.p1 GENE.Phypoly_transcript_05164~~Phypoly_transcript_05164.p1  ORF type:complete len:547 (+),score=81.40 Phypoly_transcript_05164:75-1715(+)
MRKSLLQYMVAAIFFFIILQIFVLGYSYYSTKKVFLLATEGPQMTDRLFTLLEERKDAMKSITITFTNIGNVKMTRNFMIELEKVGVHNWIVVSFDAESCELLGQYCYHDESKTFNPDKVVWGTKEYFEMINYRAFLWLLLLRHGFNTFCVDTDIFLRDNPYLYLDYTYDLNIMREYPSMGTPIWQTMRQLGLCCDGDERYLNAGFFFLMSTPESIRVVEEMQKIMKEDQNVPDQDAFNIALLRIPKATVRVLDKELFPNGFVAFLHATPARRNILPVVQHANWIRDHDAKTYRARELLSWHMDDQERYATPRNYLTYYTADDMVTFDMEKDYLQLAYMLSKVLHRHLILPKFHCYINEPPGCYMDAVFDTYGLAELGYYENSMLRNPQVPAENLQSTKIYLPNIEETGTPTLKQLLKNFEDKEDYPMIEIVFPKMSQYDGAHLNFISLADRYTGGMEWKEYAEEIEQKVKFNDELLFAPWYTYWKADLDKVNYTCVVTSEQKIDYVRKFLNTLSPTNTLYVVSNNPAFPTPKALYTIKDDWGPWV